MSAGLELGRHLRIHGDHHLLLFAHDGIPLLDLVGNPCSELVAEDHGADVDDPLLGHLLQVKIVWQEISYVGLVGYESKDALH